MQALESKHHESVLLGFFCLPGPPLFSLSGQHSREEAGGLLHQHLVPLLTHFTTPKYYQMLSCFLCPYKIVNSTPHPPVCRWELAPKMEAVVVAAQFMGNSSLSGIYFT
jgi:hypothetical protein